MPIAQLDARRITAPLLIIVQPLPSLNYSTTPRPSPHTLLNTHLFPASSTPLLNPENTAVLVSSTTSSSPPTPAPCCFSLFFFRTRGLLSCDPTELTLSLLLYPASLDCARSALAGLLKVGNKALPLGEVTFRNLGVVGRK